MGLSIGVVNITYMDEPGQPMYRFMQDLMGDPDVGLDTHADSDDSPDKDGYWGDGWGTDSFYEFNKAGLFKRAEGWAKTEAIGNRDTMALLNWVENLPYRGDNIMLHLSN